MAKPPKNHPWKLGLSGPVSYNRNSQSKWRGFYRPPEADSPVRSLSASEIEELGLDLKTTAGAVNIEAGGGQNVVIKGTVIKLN